MELIHFTLESLVSLLKKLNESFNELFQGNGEDLAIELEMIQSSKWVNS